MAIERAENVTGELVVGKFYLVRAIFYPWYGHERWWPVLGPAHSDPEFFNFEQRHYHLDGRFLSDAALWPAPRSLYQPLAAVFNAPLATRDKAVPRAERRKMKCARSKIEYLAVARKEVAALNSAFAGQQAKRAKTGWICPHRRALLNALPADAEGILTCPLHGLRIHDATGKCAGPEPRPAP
ncbi:MAG: Rieske 2Fe-2S domain-containing protein [Rhodoblastus sp.]